MHVKIDVNDSFKQRILCFLNIFQTTDLIVIADTANCKLIKLNRIRNEVSILSSLLCLYI